MTRREGLGKKLQTGADPVSSEDLQERKEGMRAHNQTRGRGKSTKNLQGKTEARARDGKGVE